MPPPDDAEPVEGRRVARKFVLLVVAIAAAVAIVLVLFNYVFPWVDTLIDDPVLGALGAE